MDQEMVQSLLSLLETSAKVAKQSFWIAIYDLWASRPAHAVAMAKMQQ